MTRKIIINDCTDCPSMDHKGAFGEIAYVPICRSVKRDLPYTVSLNRSRAIAASTNVIPEWCPLEKNNDV